MKVQKKHFISSPHISLSVLFLFNHVCAKSNDGKFNENDVVPFFFAFHLREVWEKKNDLNEEIK